MRKHTHILSQDTEVYVGCSTMIERLSLLGQEYAAWNDLRLNAPETEGEAPRPAEPRLG